MSKTLVVIRHGKSTWEYPTILDVDRPLIETGISKTIQVARKLRENNILPDQIISSHANRALHTALIMAREFNHPAGKVIINPDLYQDSEDEILDLVKSTDHSVSTLFIFGHNPSFTILSNFFLKDPLENLPTSAAVVLEFETNSWTAVSRNTMKKGTVFSPKKL